MYLVYSVILEMFHKGLLTGGGIFMIRNDSYWQEKHNLAENVYDFVNNQTLEAQHYVLKEIEDWAKNMPRAYIEMSIFEMLAVLWTDEATTTDEMKKEKLCNRLSLCIFMVSNYENHKNSNEKKCYEEEICSIGIKMFTGKTVEQIEKALRTF